MSEIAEDKTIGKAFNRRVHMANERTFLAWMRTSIGIMAFGFVVVKFALFMKQMSYIFQIPDHAVTYKIGHIPTHHIL